MDIYGLLNHANQLRHIILYKVQFITFTLEADVKFMQYVFLPAQLMEVVLTILIAHILYTTAQECLLPFSNSHDFIMAQ